MSAGAWNDKDGRFHGGGDGDSGLSAFCCPVRAMMNTMNTTYTVTRWQFLAMLLIVALGTMIGVSVIAIEGIRQVNMAQATALRAEKHILDHERTEEERKARIVTLERQMEEIKTKSTARADPFTGTMGKVLETRIQAVEKSLAGIGSLSAKGKRPWSPSEAK